MRLPYNFRDPFDQQIFEQVVEKIKDKDIEVFLISGTVRNAIHRLYHNEQLEQRDYDQVVIRGGEEYLNILYELGFFNGLIQTEDQRVLFASKDGDKDVTNFTGKVCFDIHLAEDTTMEENLAQYTSLSVNGSAIPLRQMLSEDWENHIIQLSGTVESIKNRQLMVFRDAATRFPQTLFAVMRFVHNGYAPPSAEEVAFLAELSEKLTPEKYNKNIQKLENYVGGTKAAQELSRRIGLPETFLEQRG